MKNNKMNGLVWLKERCLFWLTGYLPDEITAKNAWHNLVDGMCYSAKDGLTQPFMSLFAMKLGASDPMLAFLASSPSLVSLLAQVPSAVITERQDDIKKVMIPWSLAHRINYLIFAVLPFLPIDDLLKAWIFIALVTFMNFPAAIVSTMWTHMMGNIFPSNVRAHVFADRYFLSAIVALVFLVIAGPILDYIPYPYNYSFNFGMGFLALITSTYHLSKLKEPKHESTIALEDAVSLGESTSRSVKNHGPWSGMGIVTKDKPFLGFACSALIMHIGFGVSGAMWPLFYKRQLFMNNTQIGFMSIASTASSVIWYRIVPKIMDRWGAKNTFLLALTLFMPVPLFYSFVKPESLGFIWVISAFDGMASAIYNLSLFNAILAYADDEAHRPSYLAFFNTCVSLPGVILPMIGMQLYIALGSVDVRPIFYISTVVRLSAVVMMFFVLRRKTSFTSVE